MLSTPVPQSQAVRGGSLTLSEAVQGVSAECCLQEKGEAAEMFWHSRHRESAWRGCCCRVPRGLFSEEPCLHPGTHQLTRSLSWLAPDWLLRSPVLPGVGISLPTGQGSSSSQAFTYQLPDSAPSFLSDAAPPLRRGLVAI